MSTESVNSSAQTTIERLWPLADKYACDSGAQIIRGVGFGGSSAVYLLKRGQSMVALKVYDPKFLIGSGGAAELKRINLQKQLIGHSCETLISVEKIELLNDTCFIEMEYLDWHCMCEVVSKFPTDSVQGLFNQLVLAVNYLNEMGLVHRDIKPENILIDASFTRLKLIDFGVMRESNREEENTNATDFGDRRPFIASAQYSSPEYLFRLEQPSPEMWKGLTIYQIGGVLHDMLMGVQLFDGAVKTENKFVVAKAVLYQVPSFANVASDQLELASLASSCLCKDPELRMSLVDLGNISEVKRSGVERLRESVRRSDVAKQSNAAQKQQASMHKLKQSRAIEKLAEYLKVQLISLLGKNYKVIIYNNDERITGRFTLTCGIELEVRSYFRWHSPTRPLVANVVLTAQLGTPIDEYELQEQSVGEFSIDDGRVEIQEKMLLDSVCEIIALVDDWSSLKTEHESEFIDAVEMKNSAAVSTNS